MSDLAQRLGVPLAEAERVLFIVQTFEPTGVAARNLAECLALQAKDVDRYDPAMARADRQSRLLAKGNLATLKRICGVDDEDIADMIRELRAYDPKPGCRFMTTERVDAIMPDIFVARRGGGWAVELNSATLPRLLVNRSYYEELSRRPAGQAVPRLAQRMPAKRQLAAEGARPARPHDRQGRDRARAAARRASSATASRT